MIWKKANDAAKEWCGGIHPKALYNAVKAGKLRAARYGAGRHLLFCEEWCQQWLEASAQDFAKSGRIEQLHASINR